MGKIIVKKTVRELPDHAADIRVALENRAFVTLSVSRKTEAYELHLSMAEYQGLKDAMNTATNTVENLNWEFPEADMHIE